MQHVLKETVHRPWPLPQSPWVMKQVWHDLLFIHWEVPVAEIQGMIPQYLQVDTFAGKTYLGLVPFHMSGIRPRFLPAVPYLSSFPELNVRVYVTRDNKPGVYFFSLDAANSLAVEIARFWFHLPYLYAKMSVQLEDGWYKYSSVRTDTRGKQSELQMQYRPIGDSYLSQPGTLEHWLTERYCLYANDSKNNLYRGEIHHVPWPLQAAEYSFTQNSMPEGHGFFISEKEPLMVQFVKYLEVAIFNLKKVQL
ncbi:MAG: DUF2071 domain-containing protein [Spirochaetota bacterium]